MSKSNSKTDFILKRSGFTLIELLVVAAIIGILLALAIPNLIKARISANEANAKKMMLVLRDAEGEFFEQDLNDNSTRDYIDQIGDNGTANTLRCPDPNGTCDENDALVDATFEAAEDVAESTAVGCTGPKSGYCISLNNSDTDGSGAAANTALPLPGLDDFGWMASMTSYNKTGRRDYSIYSDGVARCVIDGQAADGSGTPAASGDTGAYSARRVSPGCD